MAASSSSSDAFLQIWKVDGASVSRSDAGRSWNVDGLQARVATSISSTDANLEYRRGQIGSVDGGFNE